MRRSPRLTAIGGSVVLAFAVAQRTEEIGVRLTLGATPASAFDLGVHEGTEFVLIVVAVSWFIALALG